MAEHYKNSKIKLISKSLIRYEGILDKIDTAASTVTLRHVRSFGSENRRQDVFIPATDKVYPCIVFCGADIKELDVIDKGGAALQSAPKPQFEDPAILSMEAGPPAAAPKQHAQKSAPTPKPAPSAAPVRSAQPTAKPAVKEPPRNAWGRNKAATVSARAPRRVTAPIGTKSKTANTRGGAPSATTSRQPPASRQPVRRQAGAPAPASRPTAARTNQWGNNANRAIRGGQKGGKKSVPGMGAHLMKGHKGNTKVQANFDFEKQNQEFESLKEALGIQKQIAPAYSPQTSFFDNFAAVEDTPVRSTSNAYQHEQEQLNVSTFGQAHVNSGGRRNQPRGRANNRSGQPNTRSGQPGGRNYGRAGGAQQYARRRNPSQQNQARQYSQQQRHGNSTQPTRTRGGVSHSRVARREIYQPQATGENPRSNRRSRH